jgi:hypothetical protein
VNTPKRQELREERGQGLLFLRLRKWLGGLIVFVIVVCGLTFVLALWNIHLPIVSDLGNWIFRLVGLS